MIGRILRSLTALVVLVAAVVGAPIALWILGRQFLPDGVPNGAAIWAALWDKDTGSTFLGLLVLVGAIAWLVFTFCVIVEILARLSGRRRTWRIPGLALPQSAASALIGTLLAGTLMMGGSMASAATPPVDLHLALAQKAVVTQVMDQATRLAPAAAKATTARTSSAAATPDHGRPAPATSSRTNPVWVVSRYDTLWSIAEKTLGSGDRFQEIADLNVGAPQPDGKNLHSASTRLEIGWKLSLPSTATLPAPTNTGAAESATTSATVAAHSVKVKPGETLSGITERELGDAGAYPALAEANHLTNPDRIDVGQSIEIPAHVTYPAAAADTATYPAAPTSTPIPAYQAAAPQTAVPAPSKAAPGKHAAPKPAANALAQPGPPAVPVQAVPTRQMPTTEPGQHSSLPTVPSISAAQPPAPAAVVAAPTPVPATPTMQRASAAPATGDNSDLSTTIGIGMGAVLAGAVWAGLLATRRRRGLRRPLEQIPAAVSLPAARMERRMRERAGTVDVNWMDRALRSAAALSAGRPTEALPDVTCVWLSTDELQLQLATPVPAPQPFLAEADSWIIPTGTELPDLPGWTDPAAPFPTLASLGDQDGETLLVDLERLGAVTISGDPQRTSELLNHLAVEFAHNLWSDHLEITLVGWGEPLVILNPDRVRYVPTVADITSALKGRISEATESQQELNTTVLASRISDHTDDDIWAPQVLLIDASTGGDLTELQSILQIIAGAGRSTVAVVVRAGDLSAAGGATITIDADGMLSLPAVLGDNLQVQAASTSQADLDRLLELFASTEKFERPGPAKEIEPWAEHMDVVGDLVADELPAAVTAVETGDVDEDEEDLVDETADTEVGQNRDAQVLPIRSPKAEAARTALAAALAADPDLDEDLAEWHSHVILRPKIGVLGAPLVISNGVAPSARRSRFTEIVIYLALHREVSADKFATDLWDEKSQPSPQTRRSDVSRCRTWLGVDDQGRHHLPEARNKPYRLTRLLDLELFKRLRKRAAAKLGVGDTTGASEDLTAALRLVRGPILAEASKDAYAWLTESDPASLGQAAFTVLGAAHQLVELALAASDLDLAHIAADAGYEVSPKEDLPMRDKARIAHRAGDEAAARGWVLEILRNNAVELPEDLVNHETFVVVNEIFPQGLRGA